MKKIILEEQQQKEIRISEINFYGQYYIAYCQKSTYDYSYAILMKQTNGLYSFRSLRYPENKGTYEAATPQESIQACVASKRTVFTFSSMGEMIKAMANKEF